MSDVRIRDLDRGNDDELRTYWEIGRDAVAGRPYNTHPGWQAASTYLRTDRADMIDVRLTAWRGDRMVGAGGLMAPTLENTDTASVDVAVAPAECRTGVGTAVLAALEDRARAHGRTVLLGEPCAPPDVESPATLFAAHHGFHVEIEDGMKVVDLAATRDSWPAMAERIGPHHTDYRLVSVWGPVPAELIDGYCSLNTAFNALAPSGDAEVENEQWDEQRVRDREARAARSGREDVFTFALDAGDAVVALTELSINRAMPHRALQGGTLVLPEHRGHRLGLAIKLANHQALVGRFPQVEWAVTGNADVNAPMNAVNDVLGYRVVERCLEVRKEI